MGLICQQGLSVTKTAPAVHKPACCWNIGGKAAEAYCTLEDDRTSNDSEMVEWGRAGGMSGDGKGGTQHG